MTFLKRRTRWYSLSGRPQLHLRRFLVSWLPASEEGMLTQQHGIMGTGQRKIIIDFACRSSISDVTGSGCRSCFSAAAESHLLGEVTVTWRLLELFKIHYSVYMIKLTSHMNSSWAEAISQLHNQSNFTSKMQKNINCFQFLCDDLLLFSLVCHHELKYMNFLDVKCANFH